MAQRRSDIVDDASPGVYHCISRCVRREPLLDDPSRREWLVERLRLLTHWLAVDVVSFAIMRNHIHLLLAIRPEIVAGWSDHEVASRRVAALPNRRWRSRHGVAANAPPTAREIEAIVRSPRALAQARTDLSSLGFFHRLLKEPCARLWNKADGVTGHFWEGRFKSPRVLDLEALVHVARYIELNEVHAGTAATIPRSLWTSASLQWRRMASHVARGQEALKNDPALAAQRIAKELLRCDWAPVFACRTEDLIRAPDAASTVEAKPRAHRGRNWAGSALGIARCVIPLAEHLEDLHAAGQVPHPRKASRIPFGTPSPLVSAVQSSVHRRRSAGTRHSDIDWRSAQPTPLPGAAAVLRLAVSIVRSRLRGLWGGERPRVPYLDIGFLAASQRTCYGTRESTMHEAFRRGRRRVRSAFDRAGIGAA